MLKIFLSFKVKFFKLAIKRFLLKTFMPNTKAILVNAKFGKMLLDPLDNHVSRQLIKTGDYNPHEIHSIKKLLKINDNLLICGAHIGSLAIPLSPNVKKIVAIEPNPKNFELLRLNIAINNISNIVTHNFAAAEKIGTIDFMMNVENSGGSKRKPIKYRDNYYYDVPNIIKIKAFPLDLKLTEKFDVVIMDIEGSEYFAMSGMNRILRNSRIFIFEFIPAHLEDVANVTVKQFITKVPIKNFNRAYFPRLNKYIEIDQLEATLNFIVSKNSYEDGIILFKN
jgi:FkbM family methyltransferase